VTSTDQRFGAIAQALLKTRGVAQGLRGRKQGFGTSALTVNDKIFAMIASKDQFVVKLPRERVDALVAAGEGKRFDMGPGRVMKEWLVLDEDSAVDWLAVAKEAMKFVGSKS
jgi:hypothetical protein